MALVINSNIASMNTMRKLSGSQANLNLSIQRLSSGFRINSAKDDAAGLSIATRMDSQIRGNNVAIRNANDAISLAQTAEGALSSITDSLQRIRELSVQSVNATNTSVDRASLNSEVTQLKQEIERVANTTSFNGTKLLDGSFTGQNFQVGAGINETLTIDSIADVNLAALGGVTTGSNGPAFVSIPIAGLTLGPTSAGIASWTVGAGNSLTTTSTAITRANEWVTRINSVYPTAELSASINGSNLELTGNQLFIISPNSAGLTAGSYAPTTTSTAYLDTLDISTESNATTAINNIDVALTQVNNARAKLGAVQGRFESVVKNLQTTVENQSAGKSRIMDADFASETAQLTRGQILQQAGTAMLAQANTLPNNVLALLR